MKTNPNDLAYPVIKSDEMRCIETGLTKREYFAVHRGTKSEFLTHGEAELLMGSKIPLKDDIESMKWWAEAEERYAVMRADALIKVLNEQ